MWSSKHSLSSRAAICCACSLIAACGNGGGSNGNNSAGIGGASGAAGHPTGGASNDSGGTSSGGSSSDSGGNSSGGSSSAGVVCPGSDIEHCQRAGASCQANRLIECTVDDEGCLVETITECGQDVCDHLRADPTCTPREAQTADSCDEKLFIEERTSIAGDEFDGDYSDRQEFTGTDCEAATFGAAEAVFYVNVPAGESVSVSESRDSNDDPIGLDAVFGIMPGCSNTSACLISGGSDDSGGITYTAEEDETVAIWVSGVSALNGSYDINIDLPTTLGSFGGADDLPTREGGPLEMGTWEAYVVHLEEEAVLNGAMSNGNASVAAYDSHGNPMWITYTLSNFARVMEPGTYRIVVDALTDDLADYTLSMTARPWTDIGSFDTGDSFEQEYASIPDGDSRFYLFEVGEGSVAEITVTTTTGDADLWLFSREGVFWSLANSIGGTEELNSDVLEPGEYLLQVQAYPDTGDVSSHTLRIDFAEG